MHLFARCDPDTYLTLTAIHPTENRPVPSRHIRLGDLPALHDALERLHAANGLGWGAYFGLAARRAGLSRWQRGDMQALVEIPAIIADIDEPPEAVWPRIRRLPVAPSCVVSSGHGVHLYWFLSQPTRDMHAVNTIHHGLAGALQGDYLTAATALRLPGSFNTKRAEAVPCQVLECDWSRHYALSDFARYHNHPEQRRGRKETRNLNSTSLNTHAPSELIRDVADVLLACGFRWRGTWLNGPCPNASRHRHGDRHPSFGFNTATGYGYCFVCGTMRPDTVTDGFSISCS